MALVQSDRCPYNSWTHTHTEGNRVRTRGEEGVHTPRRQTPGGASAVHPWTLGVQPPDCEQVPF